MQFQPFIFNIHTVFWKILPYMLLKPEIQKLFASSHGTMELAKILEIFSQ